MADKSLRLRENAAGAFYVTEDCIDCDLCRQTAPASFQRDDATGFSTVYRQPSTPDEITLARAALEECPVEAIGDDGDR